MSYDFWIVKLRTHCDTFNKVQDEDDLLVLGSSLKLYELLLASQPDLHWDEPVAGASETFWASADEACPSFSLSFPRSSDAIKIVNVMTTSRCDMTSRVVEIARVVNGQAVDLQSMKVIYPPSWENG